MGDSSEEFNLSLWRVLNSPGGQLGCFMQHIQTISPEKPTVSVAPTTSSGFLCLSPAALLPVYSIYIIYI